MWRTRRSISSTSTWVKWPFCCSSQAETCPAEKPIFTPSPPPPFSFFPCCTFASTVILQTRLSPGFLCATCNTSPSLRCCLDWWCKQCQIKLVLLPALTCICTSDRLIMTHNLWIFIFFSHARLQECCVFHAGLICGVTFYLTSSQAEKQQNVFVGAALIFSVGINVPTVAYT